MLYNLYSVRLIKRYPWTAGWLASMGTLAYVTRPGVHLLASALIHP